MQSKLKKVKKKIFINLLFQKTIFIILFNKICLKKVKLVLKNNVVGNYDLIQQDAQRLKQVLINLISNSLKFTDGGGQIKIKVQLAYDDNLLKFEVIDTGTGIKKYVISKLAQPYQTFDENGKNQEGIGFF